MSLLRCGEDASKYQATSSDRLRCSALADSHTSLRYRIASVASSIVAGTSVPHVPPYVHELDSKATI